MRLVRYRYGLGGEAMAITVLGEVIEYTGLERDAPPIRAGEGIHDFEAALALPGFVDCHTHFGAFAMLPARVDLSSAASLDQALAAVQAHAADLPPGRWVVGKGWDKNPWPEGRFPAASDLDVVLPDGPAFLWSRDGHAGWLNSPALADPHVARTIADARPDWVRRDPETGRPTGILFEDAAYAAFGAVPSPPTHVLADLIEAAVREAHKHGVTGVHDMSGLGGYGAFDTVRDRGGLKLRVIMSLDEGAFQDAVDSGVCFGQGDEWLRIGPLKLYADGALGSQTAHMLDPYEGSESRGIELLSTSELTERVELAHAGGFPVAVHAIGDAAVRSALDALERAGPAPEGRDRIEHAQLVHPDDVPRFARLGVVASMQPGHIPGDIAAAQRYWGERCRHAYPIRTLMESGADVWLGTDVPVIGIDPLETLRAAVFRTPSGLAADPPWVPEERITAAEALRAYHIGPGGQAARLAPGQPADFVILSHDIVSSPDSLEEAHVTATVVRGELVWAE